MPELECSRRGCSLEAFLFHPFPVSSLSCFIPFLFHPFPVSSLSCFIPFLFHPKIGGRSA